MARHFHIMANDDASQAQDIPAAVRQRLQDGTPVLLAPLGPGDAAGLRAGFAQLSAESRKRRFLHPKATLSDAELRYLTHVDQRDHLAWGAHDLSVKPVAGIGVARCIRMPDDPRSAEVALTVVDAYQGRGVGRLLLERLAAAARRQGIHHFRASAAADNPGALALARHCGATVERAQEGLVALHLTLD